MVENLVAGFFTYADPQFVADAGWDVALVNASFAWVADEVAQLPTPGVFQVRLYLWGIIPTHLQFMTKRNF
jgi:hypothetical protein